MTTVSTYILELLTINSIATSLFLLAAVVLSRCVRSPAVRHTLWAMLLVRLIVPPLFHLPVPGWRSWGDTVTSQTGSIEAAHDLSAHRTAQVEEKLWEADVPSRDGPWLSMAPGKDTHVASSSTERPVSAPIEQPARASGPLETTSRAVTDRELPIAAPSQPRISHTLPVAASDRLLAKGLTKSLSWRTGLFVVWCLGAVFYAIQVACSAQRVCRVVRHARPASDELERSVETACMTLGVRRMPQVLTVAGVLPPLLWPLARRPVLVVPEPLMQKLSRAQRAAVIAHEVAHLRRRDHWVRWLEVIVNIVYWWYPARRWISRELRRVEELCCDGLVIAHWPESRRSYGEALLTTIGMMRAAAAPSFAHGLGFADYRDIKTRLESLQSPGLFVSSWRTRLSRVGWVLLVMLVVAGPSMGLPISVPLADESASTSPIREPQWPDDFEMQYDSPSPDGERVAFVGWTVIDGQRQDHALYLADRKSKSIRRLLDIEGLKSAPSWSRDGTTLAVAAAPGYPDKYPLAFIDVTTGQVTRTGVFGSSPDWAPDGVRVAVQTRRQTGHIAVYDLHQKRLTQITPDGYDIVSSLTGEHARGGALHPQWSPDGQWIAWRQWAFVRDAEGERRTERLWVKNIQSGEIRKVADEAATLRWSDDGLSLELQYEDKPVRTVTLSSLPIADAADVARPPERLVAMVEEERRAAREASEYDPLAVREANRDWLNPQLLHLQSVSFTHKMDPIRLDERFSWVRETGSVVEVTYREDEHATEEVGRMRVWLSDGTSFSLAPDARYPRASQLAPADAAAQLRDHLMGTRLKLAVFDWARHPEDFELVEVRPSGDLTKLRLLPRRRRDREFNLHGGAMFETTSWAYVHHLGYRYLDLYVDPTTLRIVREVDTGEEGEVCRAEFSDWIASEDDRSVPGRIQLHFAGQSFRVDDRFQWHPLGLWQLVSGTSQFDGHEAQSERVEGLVVNEPNPQLDTTVARVRAAYAALQPTAAAAATDRATLVVDRFALAAPAWRSEATTPAAALPDSVAFGISDKTQSYREMGGAVTLEARLALKRELVEEHPHETLFLTMFDERSNPVVVDRMPMAAVVARWKPAAPILATLHQQHGWWLAPFAESPAGAAEEWEFQLWVDGMDALQTPDSLEALHRWRGITLTTGWEQILKNPDRYAMPLAFTAQWRGRNIQVVAIAGPPFHGAIGNGIHGWRGYTIGTSRQMLVVVDQATGRPLWADTGHLIWEFSNYAPLPDGRSVPLRVRAGRRDDRDPHIVRWNYDFRFQLLDGGHWFFDRSMDGEGKLMAEVRNVRRNGAEVSVTRKLASDEDLENAPALNWQDVTDRQITSDMPTSLVREIVQHDDPTLHPDYELWSRIEWEEGTGLIWNLGHSAQFPNVKYWSLSSVGENGQTASFRSGGDTAARVRLEAVVQPYREGVAIPWPAPDLAATENNSVHGRPSGAGEPWVRQVRMERGEDGRLRAVVELVSTQHNYAYETELDVVLLDKAGCVVNAGAERVSVRVERDVYARDLTIPLASSRSDDGAQYLMIGCRSTVTGMLRSTWATFMDDTPIFPVSVLLQSADPGAWRVGLESLMSDVWDEIGDNQDDAQRAMDIRRIIKPHEELVVKIVRMAAGEELPNGDRGQSVSDATLATACILLGQLGEGQHRAVLEGALRESRSEHVRYGAALGLALLGSDEGVAVLRKAMGVQSQEFTSRRDWARFQHQARVALERL